MDIGMKSLYCIHVPGFSAQVQIDSIHIFCKKVIDIYLHFIYNNSCVVENERI